MFQDLQSVTDIYNRETSSGSQKYMQVAPDQNTHDLVGRPLPMTSALKQASGEAVFTDDLPPMAGE